MIQRLLFLILIAQVTTLHPVQSITEYLSQTFSMIGIRILKKEEKSFPSFTDNPIIITCHSEKIIHKENIHFIPHPLSKRTRFKCEDVFLEKPKTCIPKLKIYRLPSSQRKNNIYREIDTSRLFIAE